MLPAQPLAQRPIDEDQFARAIVVKEIAGMRIAMKYDVGLGREQRQNHYRLDELFGYSPAPRRGQPSGCTGHFDSLFFRKRGDSVRAQRLNKSRNSQDRKS